MRDDHEHEPGEHQIKLLQGMLAVTVFYLVLPCLGCGLGLRPAELAAVTGLPRRTAVLLVFVVPGALAVLLSLIGVVLARSVPSRLLFVGTGVLGILLPFVLGVLAE